MESKYFVVFDQIGGGLKIRLAEAVTTENMAAYLCGTRTSQVVVGHADTFQEACIEIRKLREKVA